MNFIIRSVISTHIKASDGRPTDGITFNSNFSWASKPNLLVCRLSWHQKRCISSTIIPLYTFSPSLSMQHAYVSNAIKQESKASMEGASLSDQNNIRMLIWIRYCSMKYQKNHWKEHKKQCMPYWIIAISITLVWYYTGLTDCNRPDCNCLQKDRHQVTLDS